MMAAIHFAAYLDPVVSQPRMGHYDLQNETIQPLHFLSGTAVTDMYQVIEAGESLISPGGQPFPAASVQLLAPITGRDILAVGKNYSEHAKEFNQSGYDSSDKVDQPTHPVIFTKRATSIIAHGDSIFSHPGFTESLDYEGEIGVIIGKAGFRIDENAAMDHVWGYTIINDVTARERQRDHKQFYIGKSADTFCPMIQTHVNGEARQDSTTNDLIFSIPKLIKTMSEGQTLQPGDVLATGTPAGVGIGRRPPVFLKPGDEIAVSVTGLGTLRNKVSDNLPAAPALKASAISPNNFAKSVGGVGLTDVGGKLLHYKKLGGDNGTPIVFIHGLGGTLDYWRPLISGASLADRPLHLFDLEGHGLSPTSPLSILSIGSFASDLLQIFKHAGITGNATVIAHSMGCLVAATFACKHPELVKKLILLGPPPSPLPAAGSQGSHARAATVRKGGMSAVVDAIVGAGTSQHTQANNALATTAIRLSLLGQDPEGYAKGCSALAGATDAIPVESLEAETLILTGDNDAVCPPALAKAYGERIAGSEVSVLPNVGHWHLFEDPAGVSHAVAKFLS
ncbi:Alpha/beta hydrolase fold-1 [Macrophomina phaseolina MS6]|uniref:Alpha/beta hydrolase fold-1 n=1 Tax=Macrophomina phaseolina (strain MS6) TaxID=1126212 RepID=K2SVK4_MACPH|nr:Alpha/beta hydrolase fold-1 [Macrophomina phaseolina MS6]